MQSFYIRRCTSPSSSSAAGGDFLSSLPDEILIDILCRLPTTKEVVANSVLSKRWRHLYTWATTLNFDYSYPLSQSHCLACPHLSGRFHLFKMFVASVLQRCQSHKLDSFSLRLSKGIIDGDQYHHKCAKPCLPVLNSTLIYSWLSFPLSRGIRQLELCIHVTDPECTKLPGCVFSCKTLEVLKLDINLEILDPVSFSLPHLKLFHLTSVPDLHEDFLNDLVASCPLLEDLAFQHCCFDTKNINISAPYLQKLVLIADTVDKRRYDPVSGNYFIPDEEYYRDHFVLNAPNLQYLVLGDHLSQRYSIGNLNALVQAHIKLQPAGGGEEETDYCILLTLLRTLTNTRQLCLGASTIQYLEDGHDSDSKYKMPMFDNLKHLQLLCNSYNQWRNMLLDILSCTHFLETLSFPEGIAVLDYPEDDYDKTSGQLECQYWTTTQSIPSCVTLHLKRIAMQKFRATQRALEMVKYFMRNALVLEELVLTCVEDSDRIVVEKALQECPKGSLACMIFVGQL